MNVPPQRDKRVNKTCGAGGGEEMGRTHPHFDRSPQDTALPIEQPCPRHQPGSLPPLPPGPVERSRFAVGDLTEITCFFLLCFLFQRKIRASRGRMRMWAQRTHPRRSGNAGRELISLASSFKSWKPLSRETATQTCPLAKKSPCGPTLQKPESG